MGGETILVVEDVPESLKFAAGALRGAGYKVQIASSGEQALSTLRFLQPQLILVDFMLPGINGLELTARVKQDPRLRKTLVVALTSCAMPQDAELAREAGCDGYLTKPIDAPTLAARIREYLDLGRKAPFTPAAAPAPAPAPSAASEAPAANSVAGIPEDEMAELRESFLKAGRALSRQLLASLDGQFDEAKASRTVHPWIGTAGLLGFPTIAHRARDVEMVLRTPPWTVARLRGPVTNLARAFHNPAAGEATPSPAVERSLAGKRVALIGLSEDEAERLCAALEQVGAKPRLFDADQSPYVEAVANCHIVLVHARPGTEECRWLAPEAIGLPALPAIFIGQPEHLLSLRPTVLARACGLLMEGSLAEEALMRLRIAVSHAAAPLPHAARAEAGELVIADSDESSREQVRTALERYGLPCRLAANGPDTLLLLRHLRPAAAVLDAGMDGCEVLAAIRAEAMPVRTILLLPQPEESEILRGVSLGAGDYLVQPFSAVELVARLKRLLA